MSRFTVLTSRNTAWGVGAYDFSNDGRKDLFTSATGVHDVYMVIHGSGGIGNVNWFQFQ